PASAGVRAGDGVRGFGVGDVERHVRPAAQRVRDDVAHGSLVAPAGRRGPRSVPAQVPRAARGAGGVDVLDPVGVLGVGLPRQLRGGGVAAGWLGADVIGLGGDERGADQVVVGAAGGDRGERGGVDLPRQGVFDGVDRQVDRVEVVGIDEYVDALLRVL